MFDKKFEVFIFENLYSCARNKSTQEKAANWSVGDKSIWTPEMLSKIPSLLYKKGKICRIGYFTKKDFLFFMPSKETLWCGIDKLNKTDGKFNIVAIHKSLNALCHCIAGEMRLEHDKFIIPTVLYSNFEKNIELTTSDRKNLIFGYGNFRIGSEIFKLHNELLDMETDITLHQETILVLIS